MSTQTINAAENPALANKLVNQMAQTTAPEVERAMIVPPSETVVNLPGGYVTFAGEVVTDAEVRELNGRDEEAISRATSIGKVLNTILTRGTVRIGEEPATEDILDQMFAGDRDALLLGIYKATFGATADVATFCNGCKDYRTVRVEVDSDIKIKKLKDPIADRKFSVKGKKNEYTLVLPSGKVQKDLGLNSDKNLSELTTILLEGTVVEINGNRVISKNQIQEIGLADRRSIADAINKRSFGPIFDDVRATCPECGGEVVAPINIGTLFRF